jgi:hypothetical protein
VTAAAVAADDDLGNRQEVEVEERQRFEAKSASAVQEEAYFDADPHYLESLIVLEDYHIVELDSTWLDFASFVEFAVVVTCVAKIQVADLVLVLDH